MKNSFEGFLRSYASHGCTVDLPSCEELDTFTTDYINQMDPFFYFTSIGVEDYLDYLKAHLTDTNKHFFVLQFDERRYTRFLEIWIQGLFELDQEEQA